MLNEYIDEARRWPTRFILFDVNIAREERSPSWPSWPRWSDIKSISHGAARAVGGMCEAKTSSASTKLGVFQKSVSPLIGGCLVKGP